MEVSCFTAMAEMTKMNLLKFDNTGSVWEYVFLNGRLLRCMEYSPFVALNKEIKSWC